MDSHATAHVNFVDMNWSLAPFGRTDYLPFEELPPKPATFDEMAGLAKKLSFGIPFVRVDLFEYCGRPRFSEMTFHNCSGYMLRSARVGREGRRHTDAAALGERPHFLVL